MKKIIAIIMTSTFALASAMAVVSITYATDNHIPGFVENMDDIWLSNATNSDLHEKIKSTYQEYSEQEQNRIMSAPDFAKSKIGLEGTVEEQWEHLRNSFKLDYSKGFKYYSLHTNRYMKQYVDGGNFVYLIDESFWWIIPTEGKILGSYSVFKDGTPARSMPSKTALTFDNEMLDFLVDYDSIKNMLRDAGETRVNDIKIIAQPLSMLYIAGEQNDYLIRLGRRGSEAERNTTFAGNVDRFLLFTVKEMMDKLVIFPEPIQYYDGDINRNAEMFISRELLATKPTYETEGVDLMADGLIQGNEKGLDPLKPLTRMEATTILVRALGYEGELTQETSEFVDISNDHWGKKYANIAKDKGITMGVGDGKFAPDDIITSTQFATLLLRNSEPMEFDWEQAINILIERGIVTTEQAAKMDLFTRGDMAKIIYEAREKGLLSQ